MHHPTARVARPSFRKGWLNGRDRNRSGDASFVELPWDEALDTIAGRLTEIREKYGSESLAWIIEVIAYLRLCCVLEATMINPIGFGDAAGPCGEDETIVVSLRSEYALGHVFETDGNDVQTLSYQYVEGLGWKGADGSVYVRTDDGWEYIAPETATI